MFLCRSITLSQNPIWFDQDDQGHYSMSISFCVRMVTGSITCLIWSVLGWSLALLPVFFGLCLDGHWLYYLSYLVCVWMVTGSITCLIWSVFGWSLALLPVLFGLCLDGHWLYYLSFLVCV